LHDGQPVEFTAVGEQKKTLQLSTELLGRLGDRGRAILRVVGQFLTA
jgi:hypothetical protein